MSHTKANHTEEKTLDTQAQLWGQSQISGVQQELSTLPIKDLFPEIIHQSDKISRMLETVYKAARSQISVLIMGESGTGKELIASAIHRLSPRAHKAFVAINCSAIPENLLEAELFGHEKGAFTGADRKRIGHFGAANQGTLFLDEIGDMPLRLQAKLLRVLQEKQYTPLGSRQHELADLRIIAATNIDLEEAVQSQKFRLDLFYRLNVLPVKVPPLRERKEDIPLLLDHFTHINTQLNLCKNPIWFDQQTKEYLSEYQWPGNIRQLQNLVERLTILHDGGLLSIESLPEDFLCEEIMKKNSFILNNIGSQYSEYHATSDEKPSGALCELNVLKESISQLFSEGFHLGKYIQNIENKIILEALKLTKNNKNQAAKLLGLNRTTLVERIKKRRIE